jgi:uncharacterized membrane protein YkoI
MKVAILIMTALLVMPVAAFSGKHPYTVRHLGQPSDSSLMLAAAKGERSVNVSPGAAAGKVQKRYGGKILSVKLGKNKVAYRVKILTEAGVVKIVTVDAASGRIVH